MKTKNIINIVFFFKRINYEISADIYVMIHVIWVYDVVKGAYLCAFFSRTRENRRDLSRM